jgi:hypothetical protein
VLTPSLRVELKAKNRKSTKIDFVVSMDGATIPDAPGSCFGRPNPKAELTTAFFVSGPGGHGASVDTSIVWRCNGTKLRAN